MMSVAKQLRDALVFWAEDYPHEGGREDATTYKGHCAEQLATLVEPELSALLIQLDQIGQGSAAAMLERAFDALRRFAYATDRLVESIDRAEEPTPLATDSIAVRAGDDGFKLLHRCHDLLAALDDKPGRLAVAGQADSKTDSNKKKEEKYPENPKVYALATFIKKHYGPRETRKSLALQFTDGDEKLAANLLRQLRGDDRYAHLLDGTPFKKKRKS